jgi:hypothetical protein
MAWYVPLHLYLLIVFFVQETEKCNWETFFGIDEVVHTITSKRLMGEKMRCGFQLVDSYIKYYRHEMHRYVEAQCCDSLSKACIKWGAIIQACTAYQKPTHDLCTERASATCIKCGWVSLLPAEGLCHVPMGSDKNRQKNISLVLVPAFYHGERNRARNSQERKWKRNKRVYENEREQKYYACWVYASSPKVL